ncbi:MAG: hypothetical protein LBE84_08200 [Planctomycetota bacterium]|nr:hypothetical protein [Planctomycetota bacterium]
MLQATGAFFAILAFSLAQGIRAGDDVGITPRQAEILHDLSTFAPVGYGSSMSVPWMLSIWDTDAGLAELTPFPAGTENAAAAFSRLEKLYPTEKDILADGGEDSGGVLELLAAARMGECRLTPEYYPDFDRLTAQQPDFAVLRSYLEALRRRAARAEREGRPAEAQEALQAILLCGRHLTRDKSTILVYMTGLIFKLRGIQDSRAFLIRTGRIGMAEHAAAYADRLGEILRLFHWKSGSALGEMERFASLPATARIAREDAETCWRKEAILRLGIIRHGVVDKDRKIVQRHSLFERNAEIALEQAATGDPDPGVRRLAIWSALNVRPDSFVSLRHIFIDP